MKVVDAFGAHLPVLAKRFPAIGELVTVGKNGKLFDTPTELRQALVELASGFTDEKCQVCFAFYGILRAILIKLNWINALQMLKKYV